MLCATAPENAPPTARGLLSQQSQTSASPLAVSGLSSHSLLGLTLREPEDAGGGAADPLAPLVAAAPLPDEDEKEKDDDLAETLSISVPGLSRLGGKEEPTELLRRWRGSGLAAAATAVVVVVVAVAAPAGGDDDGGA